MDGFEFEEEFNRLQDELSKVQEEDPEQEKITYIMELLIASDYPMYLRYGIMEPLMASDYPMYLRYGIMDPLMASDYPMYLRCSILYMSDVMISLCRIPYNTEPL